MGDTLFQDTGTFMLRSAILPFSVHANFFDPNVTGADAAHVIQGWCRDQVIRESILVASKNLYETMNSFAEGKTIKKKEQFLNSLYKYVIRMSTRPTPFGLFSGVGFGRMAEGNSLWPAHASYAKKARPDLQWLMKVVKQIELDYASHLQYSRNSSIFIKGDRVVLPHSTLKEEIKQVQEVNIRATKACLLIFEAAGQPVPFQQLEQLLMEHYAGITEEKMHSFLLELIEKEYLISNIRPPLTVLNQFDYLIRQLQSTVGEEDIVEQLKMIARQIEAYNRTPLGSGEQSYLDLYQMMNEVALSATPLQVDLALQGEQIQLDAAVSKDVSHLIEMLLKLSPPAEEASTPMNSYRQDFIEKYGEGREIPLLEMIDEDLGIGAPLTYTNPPSLRTESGVKRILDDKVQAYLWNKYAEALLQRDPYIELKDNEIDSLGLSGCPYQELPQSLDINLMVMKNHSGEYQYCLGPNVGATKAGKSFGRFSHIMNTPEAFFETLKERYHLVTDRDEYVSCEVSYLPNELRHANVTRNIHGNDYEMALFTNNSRDSVHALSLDDIVIGVEGSVFYAKSKRLNKKVAFYFHNMLNPQIAPNSVRFLHDIGLEGERKWYNIPWEIVFQNVPYTPGIKYGRFILAPERWLLHSLFIPIGKTSSFEHFKEAFSGYRTKFRVPRLVYITSGDNRVLIHLEDDKSLRILYHEFTNQQTGVSLTACEPLLDDRHNISGERYVREIIIPMVKVHQPRMQKPAPVLSDYRLQEISSRSPERLQLPFEQWLYLKLYGARSREEELIGYQFQEAMQGLTERGLVEEHFYIRYADPKPHIRLRLRGQSGRLQEAFPVIRNWLRSLMDKGLISHFVIDCYDRELERYGGADFIDAAEHVFCQDSVVAEKLIQARKHHIDWSNEVMGTAVLIRFMEQWGWDSAMMLEFLSAQVDQGDYRDSFKAHRSELMKLCNPIDNWKEMRQLSQGELMLEILDERTMAVQSYSRLIHNNTEQLSTHPWAIVDSLLHMHCNRLFGIDRKLEDKLRALACHTLYALQKYYQHLVRA